MLSDSRFLGAAPKVLRPLSLTAAENDEITAEVSALAKELAELLLNSEMVATQFTLEPLALPVCGLNIPSIALNTDSKLDKDTLAVKNCLQELLVQLALPTDSLTFTALQLQQLLHYYYLRLAYNLHLNLSRISSVAEIITADILDCVALYLQLKTLGQKESALNTNNKAKKLLDIGTGSGVPGLLLAILLPDHQIYLLDSVGKKLSFLAEVVQALNLKNVTLIWQRIEDFASGTYRESFDLVVARAVSALPTLLEYALPLTKVSQAVPAYFLCLKNVNEQAADSLKAAELMGAKYLTDVTYALAGENYARTLLVYKKVAPCPPQFPRPFNLPRTKALDIS